MRKLKKILLSGLLAISMLSTTAIVAYANVAPTNMQIDESTRETITDVQLFDENGNRVPLPRAEFGKSTIPAGYTMTFGSGYTDPDIDPNYARAFVCYFDKSYKVDYGLKLLSSGTYKHYGTNVTGDGISLSAYQIGQKYQYFVTNKTSGPLQVLEAQTFFVSVGN